MSGWPKAMAVALPALVGREAAAQPLICADVALVLAIDSSSSITDNELDFQKKAIAAALRSDAVRSTVESAGTVALSAVFWGDGEFASQHLDWFVIYRGEGLEDFAHQVETASRQVHGNTNIGSGLWAALDLLADPGICARRSIINLSGDGKETIGPKKRVRATLYQARLRAVAKGITINALAIPGGDGDLASYYAEDVVRGTGGFTMEVENVADYAEAFRRKLLRELSMQSLARLPPRGSD